MFVTQLATNASVAHNDDERARNLVCLFGKCDESGLEVAKNSRVQHVRKVFEYDDALLSRRRAGGCAEDGTVRARPRQEVRELGRGRFAL